MSASERAASEMNKMGREGTPFLFIIDFQKENPVVAPLHLIDPEEILFSVNGITNFSNRISDPPISYEFKVELPDKEVYMRRFNKVMQHLKHGDSYLLNLTMPVKVSCNLSIKQIFERSKARYRLWLKDQFTVFSPEPFVRIVNGKIFSYPMKGTIDASTRNAMDKLLHDEKELAEHYTIVDLIRNDLNIVARQVRVDKFRYVEELNTSKGKLLQTSSLISGQLPAGYHENIGNLMMQMLPAGSISGAPKKKTLEIITATEEYKRGYYTGVCGYFRDNNLDCGVMIRFIEQQGSNLYFKAGGGITVNSNADDEYNELVSKVYLPF